MSGYLLLLANNLFDLNLQSKARLQRKSKQDDVHVNIFMFLKQRLCISDLLPAKMENASLFRIASHRFLDFRATISKWSYPIAVKCHCLCSVKAMPPYRGSVCSYSTDSHQLKNFRTSTTSGHTHFSSSTCIVSNISGRPNLNESLNINLMRNIQQRHLTSSSHNRIASKENVSLKPNTAIDYIDCSDSKVLDLIKDNFLVYEDFISEEEETSILQEIEPYLNRLKYELNHWDDVSVSRLYGQLFWPSILLVVLFFILHFLIFFLTTVIKSADLMVNSCDC